MTITLVVIDSHQDALHLASPDTSSLLIAADQMVSFSFGSYHFCFCFNIFCYLYSNIPVKLMGKFSNLLIFIWWIFSKLMPSCCFHTDSQGRAHAHEGVSSSWYQARQLLLWLVTQSLKISTWCLNLGTSFKCHIHDKFYLSEFWKERCQPQI